MIIHENKASRILNFPIHRGFMSVSPGPPKMFGILWSALFKPPKFRGCRVFKKFDTSPKKKHNTKRKTNNNRNAATWNFQRAQKGGFWAALEAATLGMVPSLADQWHDTDRWPLAKTLPQSLGPMQRAGRSANRADPRGNFPSHVSSGGWLERNPFQKLVGQRGHALRHKMPLKRGGLDALMF